MSCCECKTSGVSITKYSSYLICAECAPLVLKYYRRCTRCTDGLISPMSSDGTLVCERCTEADPNIMPEFPCQTVGCRKSTGAKWKKQCAGCFANRNSGGNTCVGSGCGKPTGATWKKYCESCYPAKTPTTGPAPASGVCLTCSKETGATWKKYCDVCYPATISAPATGFVQKCLTCPRDTGETWKKHCGACYSKTRGR